MVPDAKLAVVQGKNIVAVPHTLDVVRLLRNLGMAAPSPVLTYYDWPGRFEPFTHQRETTEFLTVNPRAFCLNDMGTGKTLSTLWAFDYLRSLGVVHRALIVSPLSTLERTWGDEIFRNFGHLTFAVLHGTSERRSKLLAQEADIYIINHDGIKDKRLLAKLGARSDINLIVVDELASFRNAGTDRWRALNTLVNGVKAKGQIVVPPRTWVWGLTGTPTPNEPTDAWAQCRLLTPGSVPTYFGAFRDTVMRQLTQYKWVARDDAIPKVFAAMQPGIRFSREQCIDLPPTTYMTRDVALTAEQARMYKDMMTRFKAELAEGQVTAMNEAVRINKLLQIVCGVAYTDAGDLTIPAKPRVDQVLEIIEEAGAKVIVFVPLTGALSHLHEAIESSGTEALMVHGGVSKAARDSAFSQFMDPHGPRVLVAQPGTMAHGLSLTAANTIVWFAPVHSAETYQQANARIVRPGQKNKTLIVRIQGSELERRMYAKLEKRETSQGVLLDMFA